MKDRKMGDIKNFLDKDGKLKVFPSKRSMKVQALLFLAQKFEPNKVYTEREVNDILNQWHTFGDPATLRREMFNYCIFNRTLDGREYTLAEPLPDIQL